MTTFLSDGGPLFMYTILLIMICIIVLLALSFAGKTESIQKNIKVINALAAFVLAWGFAGQVLGLMGAFEVMEMAPDISPQIMVSGLRISFYAPLFGLFTFLIAKLGVAILHWTKK